MRSIFKRRCPECNGKIKIEILGFGQICYECEKCGAFFDGNGLMPSDEDMEEFEAADMEEFEITEMKDNYNVIDSYNLVNKAIFLLDKVFMKWLQEEERKSFNTAKQYAYFVRDIKKHYYLNERSFFPDNINNVNKINKIVKLYDFGGKYQAYGDSENGGRRNAIKAYARFLKYNGYGVEEDSAKTIKCYEKADESQILNEKSLKQVISQRQEEPVKAEQIVERKKEIIETIIANRSACHENGKCKFIKKDGSYILADDNGMENSSLPWAGDYVKVNIFDEKDGIIIDWNWEK